MDTKPTSNKQKRLDLKRRRERKAERRLQEIARVAEADKGRLAEKALKETRSLRRDPERVLQLAAKGQAVRVPVSSDLHAVATLFAGLRPDRLGGLALRPDLPALRRLVLLCHERTGLLGGREASRYASALLALSAHSGRWVRSPDDWEPRSHNTYRQFHALVRHLTARYDVPTFMDGAWLEGLTAAGVVHQRWFLHVAQGQNIRTAEGLTVPLTKRQAHLYLRAPDDFDVLSGFRWAQIIDLGGDERLVRSVLATWAGADFAHDEFWATVFRWLIERPMLDAVHHGPIIDYLHDQRFTASVPNPLPHLPGQPRVVAPQPNLTMKGRSAETLLRAVAQWHRRLGRGGARPVTFWEPSGIAPFRHEEGQGETRRVFTTTELLSSRELDEEGRAMGHCAGTYAGSCAGGHVSIWSLTVADAWGREERLLTLEVFNRTRVIVQARRRFNKLPSEKELSLLKRWCGEGGPTLSKWL